MVVESSCFLGNPPKTTTMALTTLCGSASSRAALIPGHSPCASPSSSSSSSSVSFSLDRRQALNGPQVTSGRRGVCLERCFKRLSIRAGAEAGAGGTEVTGPVVRTPSTPAPRKAGAGLSYKDAGVDIDAGSELVRRIAALTPGIGGFGGLFPLGDSYLVAGTDGVGTKLKVAFELDIHDTIGIDLVAMSVNDIVTSGAKPLFFLDYFACSHLDVDQAEQVIKGIVDGCRQSDCVLLGGETAEMPDFHPPGYYEVSGTAVGIVRKDALIDGRNIIVGDQIIGLASSGVHSNGFSLVRSILAQSGATLRDPLPGADGVSIGEALLAPTVIYVRQILELVNKGGVKGIAHITGGGFTDNIPRILPSGLAAQLNVGAWNVLPIFKWLQKTGDIAEAEMLRTFNMGIGMVLVVDLATADKILATQPNARLLGEVVDGEGVTYIGQ